MRSLGSSHVGKDSEISQEISSTESKPKESSVSVDLCSTITRGASSISISAAESASAVNNVHDKKVESVLRAESLKESQKPGNREHLQCSHQVGGESYSSLLNQIAECCNPSKTEISKSVEAESNHSLSKDRNGESSSKHSDATSVSSSDTEGGPVGETRGPVEDAAEELAPLKQDYNDLKHVPQQSPVEAAVVGKTLATHDSDVQPTAFPFPVEIDKKFLDTPRKDQIPSGFADGGDTSTSHASLNRTDSMHDKEDPAKSGMPDSEAGHVTAVVAEINLRSEVEVMESARPTSSSSYVSSSSRGSLDSRRVKNTISKSKKKRREILQKADAAGTTSDLYMAYKGPEENKETSVAAENMERTSDDDLKQIPSVTGHENSSMNQEPEPSRPELDDWEDAAYNSSPRLESTSDDGQKAVSGKKYTRDFLLTFSDQCADLPEGFEITADIADIFVYPNVSVSRVSDREYPTPGRIDRQNGGPWIDRRGSGMMVADRWSKPSAPLPPGRDMRPDLGYGGNVMGLRPGVLRNPRTQAPVQYAGAILSGPMQSLGPQGGMQRNNFDSDRWQRGTNFQKGLMPPPQTPSQVMHRAEKKYEVGKVTDEEQAKQRTLKSILNKLTPQNFEKLFEKVKEVNIDNAVTLTGVISQIFDKALIEPTFCQMYADFCCHLASELPDLSVDYEKITFKRLLLNKCQVEFERGEREEEEANKADGEGELKQSDEEREEKRLKARRRMLGNIRLIGELYKKRMLTERIMHECIKKLFGQYHNPDEEDIEALCKLMSTIGEMIDDPKAKEHMDAYFDIMAKLANNTELSSRVRFMLKDAIDLRKNKWQQRRKVEGPKKIDEVHRDAAQERQAQTSRLNRGPGMNSSMRRGQPVDFSPRGSSVLPSPVGQVGGFRGLPNQARGCGAQDARFEEKNAFENRTLSVTLPQRPFGDDSITLGPQGGLGRGMSIKGQPSPSDLGETRRMTGSWNGCSFVSERASFNSREEPVSRYTQERLGGPNAYDQSSNPQIKSGFSNRGQKNPDHNNDGPLPALPPLGSQAMPPVQDVSSEKMWPESHLQDMLIAAIKEFYW
ncbi:hypothetical protein Dimus_005740 [Dionaea muscipula]